MEGKEVSWLKKFLKNGDISFKRSGEEQEAILFSQSDFCKQLHFKSYDELGYTSSDIVYKIWDFEDNLDALNSVETYARAHMIPNLISLKEFEILLGPKKNELTLRKTVPAHYDIKTVSPIILRYLVENANKKFSIKDFFLGKGTSAAIILITKDQILRADCMLAFNFQKMDCDHLDTTDVLYSALYGNTVDCSKFAFSWQFIVANTDGNILIQLCNQHESGNRISFIYPPNSINEFQFAALEELNREIESTFESEREHFTANPMEFAYSNPDGTICANNLNPFLDYVQKNWEIGNVKGTEL